MDKIDRTRPVHLIVNPHSGYGSSRHALGELRAEAKRTGVELVEYTTRSAGDATRYAREIADGAAAAIVWGGDGTVNEVANALAGTDVPILPCQAGTENLLARELRVPTRPAEIIDALLTGRIVACDTGRINGKDFLLIVGVGFDGEVVRRLTADRTGHITHLSYFWPIWRTFWEHRYPLIRAVADGEEVFHGPGLAFVGNISRYATGLRICRDAHFDDGMLDLIIFSCHGRVSLVRHAARTLVRTHPSHRSVVSCRFEHLTLTSDAPVPSEVDGDVGPDTPLEISVLPQRIKLIVPVHHHGRRFRRNGDQSK